MSLRAWLAVATIAGLCSGCDGHDLSDARFRTARQQRSVLALTRYLQDDYGNDHNPEARALIDHQYRWLLARVDAEGLGKTLLEAAAQEGDPRIAVRVNRPALSPALGTRAASYFGDGSSWDYLFADGASAAAARAFDFESVVFSYEDSFDFEPSATTPVVDIDWTVAPTGDMFSLPPSIVDLSARPEAIPGIQISLELRFLLADRSEPLVFRAEGRPVEGFRYSTSLGMATPADLFRGMLESAVEDAFDSLLSENIDE